MLRRRVLLFLAGGLLTACVQHAPASAPLAFDAVGPYTLASGDRLRIIVYGQEGLSNTYAVDGAGRVSLPLIGAVPAGGLTTQQLEKAIEARLRAGYVRDPRVAVEVELFRPFYVLGEVTNSGQFPFVNGLTVQTAVAIAGGFTPRAVRSQAEITRSVNGQIKTAVVPMNFPLQPGDTVLITERWF